MHQVIHYLPIIQVILYFPIVPVSSAGAFVTCFVVGCVAVAAAPFPVRPRPFLRDSCLFATGVLLLLLIYLSGHVYLWQAAGLHVLVHVPRFWRLALWTLTAWLEKLRACLHVIFDPLRLATIPSIDPSAWDIRYATANVSSG
ncbi:unnamed protein product [Closterium sp. Naga37s-1]|nr:unnamed protein product [Closterium sp. Naga37s-1]